VRALGLALFASQPADGLTVFKVPDGLDGAELLTRLERQYGVKLAGGQDALKGKIVRLGHMGYIDQWDVLAALGALELVLLEMGWPAEAGAGVAAFQQALARDVAAPQGAEV
jgi:aspartate aminotransferase-like enzyme